MLLTPLIALHLACALAALAIGPWVLWARLGRRVRPRWHRGLGYAWVTCMIGAVLTSAFMRDFQVPNVAGYGLLHGFIPLTLAGLWQGLNHLRHGRLRAHQIAMQWLYGTACVLPGLFALLPQRFLGQWLHRVWAAG